MEICCAFPIVFIAAVVIAFIKSRQDDPKERARQQARAADRIEADRLYIERLKGIEEQLARDGFETSRRFWPDRQDDPYDVRVYGLTMYGLLVDEKSRKLALLCSDNCNIYPFSALIESRVIVDGGQSISTIDASTVSMRGSQLGGAAIGTVVAGPVGAIIGGVTGKKITAGAVKTTESVMGVSLLVTVDDTARPNHSIRFLGNSGKGILYNSALSKAQEAHSYLLVVKKRLAGEVSKPETPNERGSVHPVRAEACKNCDRIIGRLEQAFIYRGLVVCKECYSRLTNN